jgi:hypothetical protein
MPLLDHFHAPLFPTHRWEALHASWAVAFVGALNKTLPLRYFAEPQVHLGSRVEADVAEFEHLPNSNGSSGGLAVATYAPPRPTLTIPGLIENDVTVEVRDRERDVQLVAVIELVSPSNKERDESRRGFAAKMASILRIGAGLCVIDVVTNRTANFHNELAALLNLPENCRLHTDAGLYAASYQPVLTVGIARFRPGLSRSLLANRCP